MHVPVKTSRRVDAASSQSPRTDDAGLARENSGICAGNLTLSFLTGLRSLPIWAIVIVCCALPLAWMVAQAVGNPSAVLGQLWPDAFHRALLARTIGYGLGAAAIATLLALPVALVLGRGRGPVAVALWLLLPATLLMPSIAYSYGWSQAVRLASPALGAAASSLPDALQSRLPSLGLEVHSFSADGHSAPTSHLLLTPAGPADVLRCVWSLAAWLWALPAGVIGLALRRVDTNLQQHALLDGALWRVTARQLAGPVVAAIACVMVLATQEFAVYEPTGISVVATEVRMLFQTGAFSSATNPITAPMGPFAPSPDEGARAAAAVAAGAPLLVVVALLGVVAAWGARELSASDDVDTGPWPHALRAGWVANALALLVLVVTLVVPVACLIASLQRPLNPLRMADVFGPQILGSVLFALAAAGVAAFIAFWATAGTKFRRGRPSVRPLTAALALSLVTFLIGGQLLAIALIRLYNRPAPWPLSYFRFGGDGPAAEAAGHAASGHDLFDLIYNGIPIVVMAYVARFGWLALLASNVTRSRAWRPLRDCAAVDGAGPWQTATRVIWPLAWPVLVASALLVGVLSLTEVPATVLISPLRPQPLVPLLMGWVHMLRYDDMIEGSLLLMGAALVIGLVVAALLWLALRAFRRASTLRAILYPLSSILVVSALPGCGDANQPDAIWLETGTGPGQVVYPRAIAYAPNDDSYFLVDRLARVQHLDRKGKPLGEWHMPDSLIGKPTGVSVGPDGNVYVPDTHYHRVIVYGPGGTELRRWGSEGTGPGQFIYPTDVAFDSKGRVFVSEYGDHDRIQVFDAEGRYLYAFGSFGQGDGQFSRPQSMVIGNDPATRQEVVYVTDACNHRIAVFKTDGTFVRNMGTTGSDLGQFRFPYGLAEVADGNLIVCEFGNNRVQKVDRATGKGLAAWGGPGRDPGQLAYPWAVAVDRHDRVVAVDAGNNRLQVFEF